MQGMIRIWLTLFMPFKGFGRHSNKATVGYAQSVKKTFKKSNERDRNHVETLTTVWSTLDISSLLVILRIIAKQLIDEKVRTNYCSENL